MSVVADALARATGRRPQGWDVLDSIHDVDVNVAVWRRELPSGLGDALAGWVRDGASGAELVVDPERATLGPLLATVRPAAWRRWLHADLELLLGRFAALTRARAVKIGFGPVLTDQCRRFHVDWVRYRLVTTYLGPGTEWVPDAAVDRNALAGCGDPVRDRSRIRRAHAGDVLLLEGAHAREPARAVVHRSPPIEASGAVRVVLTLTTIERT